MSRSKRTETRGTRTSALLGWLIGCVMKTLGCSLRLTIKDEAGIGGNHSTAPPCIYALWHSRFLIVPYAWRRLCKTNRTATILTSASKDGDMVARAMAAFGFQSARGSSSRRGVAALVTLKKALKSGSDVCITPDGPKGPRYRMQPGTLALARSTRAPIVPVHVRFASAWRLKTWDHFVIPKPFSKVEVTFAKALDVPSMLEEHLEEEIHSIIESILIDGTDDA